MKTKFFTVLAAVSLLIIFSAEPVEAKRKPKHKTSHKKHGLFHRKRHSSVNVPMQNIHSVLSDNVYYAFS